MLSRKQLKDVKECNTLGTELICGECAMGDNTNQEGCSRLAIETALAALNMLKQLEWIPIPGHISPKQCPICNRYSEQGHMLDCELGNMLKEANGV